MNKLMLIVLCCIFNHLVFAQKSLKPNQFEGYIISSDSVRKEVIIEIENNNFPWSFQENVKFFDKSLLSNSRIKREDKKVCLPGEYIEYGYAGKKYVYVNYYVKSKEEDNILKSTYGKIKGDKNTDFFAEVFKDGKLFLMKFYLPPVISDEDYEDDAKLQQYVDESNTT
ncbi:MAG: hypothetical protein H7X99_04465, partial [Saprospiraceae bacterium]|nr:hypothetical protein [Saprospiraceae bacterium]